MNYRQRSTDPIRKTTYKNPCVVITVAPPIALCDFENSGLGLSWPPNVGLTPAYLRGPRFDNLCNCCHT